MGLKKYPNGRVYYYRSRRQGNRVRSEYCGAGAIAKAIAEADAADRFARRAHQKAKWERLDRIEALVAYFDRATDTLQQAYLMSRGFHRPDGERWMKRRRRNCNDR